MTATQSTADQVLAYLRNYGLKQARSNRYRANRPWIQDSNSQGLALTIHGPEHGVWFDHVASEGGSLYQLATRLGIRRQNAHSNAASTPTSKRAYTGIHDYAAEHGVDTTVLTDAGWFVSPHYCYDNKQFRPALHIPTSTGARIRYLDDLFPHYRSPKDYVPCWYRLAEAVQIANQTSQLLYQIRVNTYALSF